MPVRPMLFRRNLGNLREFFGQMVYRLPLQKIALKALRADVSKYRPEVYKSEKSKILKKIRKVALGKLLT